MLATVTHINPLTSLRRARLLPVKGTVIARIGQAVTANEVVAEAQLRRKHIMLDIRSVLGLSSSTQARRLVDRKVGDRVQEGDIIAKSGGLFSRVMTSPADGVIVSISGGQILLELKSPPFRLKAGIPGEVVEIIPDRGVIIETSGVLIQGVWGNSRVNTGKLIVIGDNPEQELTRKAMNDDLRGGIVLAGYCIQAGVLKKAAEIPLNGLILGGLSSELITAARGLNLPIILLEGCGSRRISSNAFTLLKTNEGREVSINAVPWDRSTGDRPELVIVLPASGDMALETDVFKNGQAVRVNTMPYLGLTGTLVQVQSGTSLLPNGLRVPAATVLLETQERIVIPLTNMDVIE